MAYLTRSALFDVLGVKPTNPRWSWCAVSPDETTVVFTIWSDRMAKGRTRLLPDPTRGGNGAADQRRVVERAINKKMRAYGLVCVAVDAAQSRRKIKRVESDSLIPLRIEIQGSEVAGIHLEKISIGEFLRKEKLSRSGIVDLDSPAPGIDVPDRALRIGLVVIRDEKVRRDVLTRAAGRCELCKKKGFTMANGRNYLEAHHIIALANMGRDRLENVIALCPEHHREAHYGKEAAVLEGKLIECIKQLTRKRQT